MYSTSTSAELWLVCASNLISCVFQYQWLLPFDRTLAGKGYEEAYKQQLQEHRCSSFSTQLMNMADVVSQAQFKKPFFEPVKSRTGHERTKQEFAPSLLGHTFRSRKSPEVKKPSEPYCTSSRHTSALKHKIADDQKLQLGGVPLKLENFRKYRAMAASSYKIPENREWKAWTHHRLRKAPALCAIWKIRSSIWIKLPRRVASAGLNADAAYYLCQFQVG